MRLWAMAILMSLSFLSACSTTQTKVANNDIEPDKQNKIKTAKINVQLGMAYLERHSSQRAKKKFLTAIEQAPDIPEPWYSLAYYYETTGDSAQANKFYLKAISLAPKRGDTHNNYGTYLCRSGHYHASVQQFLLAIQDDDYLDTADAYENAGLCAMKAKSNKEAKHYFTQALMQDPARPVSLLQLAELNYQAGDYKTARVNLKQFLGVSQANERSIALENRINAKLPLPKAPVEEKLHLSIANEAYVDNEPMTTDNQQS